MESHGTIASASSVGPSPGPSPGPQPASKYKVGDHVEGLYKDGVWYKATIAKINGDGTYTLRWADGGTQDTVKPESKIRRSSGDGALASTSSLGDYMSSWVKSQE